ncbi:metal ABC transporter permease [Gardnerella vaginalis]|uniref:ABC transport system, permease component n=1 Tax=Gardnerella vaginalis 1500E TaxID=698957 RepID=I4M0E5_GARVA|nr:metal ABC transporter permease [Gardnerella vaginalis]EIK82685.1 ABC transport system, permease component [Gardnerella vaginalis 1500E]MCT7793296.1 metal ABC transporter permease [Lactobacillus iners]PKZ56976.1 metal ABC transporter permease [Gardnerella vaginalis]PKZ74141.1 metal ABC transporter permease [Gardnerella vaginalis]
MKLDVISKVKGQGPNTASGVLLTVGFALGFLLLKLFQPIPLKVNSFISGNILTANSLDIQVTSIALIACIITLLAYGKQIIFACLDETCMQASGYNLRKTDFIILIMITVTVVIVMPAVGSVLSISLIVGPASAAIKLSSSIWQTVIFAPILGIIAGTLGLYSSIYLGLSSGGMITVFSAIVYIVCVIIYHAKNMIIKFIQAKRDVTQMA